MIMLSEGKMEFFRSFLFNIHGGLWGVRILGYLGLMVDTFTQLEILLFKGVISMCL